MNDVIDWIKGAFTHDSSHDATKKGTVKPRIPTYPKKPYTGSQVPDLETEIPVDLVKYILKWFVAGGMSLEGAAATVANLWRESYLNPAQVQLDGGKPTGPGKGLAQWTDPTLTKSKWDDVHNRRWVDYSKDYFPALKKSHPYWNRFVVTDLEPQLSFVLHEMENGYPGVWREMSTPGSVSSKTIMVLTKYEVARDRNEKKEQNYRVMLAEKMYDIGKTDKDIANLLAKRKAEEELKHKLAKKKATSVAKAPAVKKKTVAVAKNTPKKNVLKKNTLKKNAPKKNAPAKKPLGKVMKNRLTKRKAGK